jgi:DNA-binding transcriptional LysR family regulator
MPTAGLRVLTLGVQRAVAALPIDDDRAGRPMLDLAQLAPDHVVVLPRAANPAFHDAVVSSLRQAGLSPTLVELAEPQVEHALLAVSSGAGVALLPESVVDRYAAPGIRFFPLTAPRLLLETAVLSRAGAEPGPTAAFLDALTRIGRLRPEPLVSLAA